MLIYSDELRKQWHLYLTECRDGQENAEASQCIFAHVKMFSARQTLPFEILDSWEKAKACSKVLRVLQDEVVMKSFEFGRGPQMQVYYIFGHRYNDIGTDLREFEPNGLFYEHYSYEYPSLNNTPLTSWRVDTLSKLKLPGDMAPNSDSQALLEVLRHQSQMLQTLMERDEARSNGRQRQPARSHPHSHPNLRQRSSL